MALYEQVDALGEAILQWADPENQFRGYTEVGTRSSACFLFDVPALSIPPNFGETLVDLVNPIIFATQL